MLLTYNKPTPLEERIARLHSVLLCITESSISPTHHKALGMLEAAILLEQISYELVHELYKLLAAPDSGYRHSEQASTAYNLALETLLELPVPYVVREGEERHSWQ